ncbi:serine-type peptidase [Aureococcus anophagefferens]|nr:serine-type peptidase [Aureococcus anophagefferens]
MRLQQLAALLALSQALVAPPQRRATAPTRRATAPSRLATTVLEEEADEEVASGEFVWRVEAEAILGGSAPGAFVESAPFALCGHDWTLRVYPEGLSPRRRGRCGVYLRYGAEDVGDAVDAAFELRLGGAGGPTFNTGITFVHPLAAGVLDGEATDWGGHLCSSEDARGLTAFMLAAGREAWGQRVGDDGARATLGAAGVLPGADYRVVGITRADGSRARRLRPGEGRGATVELYPIFEDRFRGAPDGGWPASLPLGGDDAAADAAGLRGGDGDGRQRSKKEVKRIKKAHKKVQEEEAEYLKVDGEAESDADIMAQLRNRTTTMAEEEAAAEVAGERRRARGPPGQACA